MSGEYEDIQSNYQNICFSISAYLTNLGADKDVITKTLLSCRSDLNLYFDLLVSSGKIKEKCFMRPSLIF